MPGRQSTLGPAKSKPTAKKQNQKRSLNALAIASQQDPEEFKIRRHRLGKAEQDNVKRKRDIPQNSGEDDDGPRISKRRRAGAKDRFGNEVEGGSDSEGNAWTLGHVDPNDDSDLDSDEAMGESDEERFGGFTFRGSSHSKPAVPRKPAVATNKTTRNGLDDIDIQEDELQQSVSGEESDDIGEDAVDLAAILDASEDEETEAWGSSAKERKGPAHTSGSDFEGQTLDREISAEEDESALSISEDEDGTNDIAKYSALRTLVSSMNPDKSIPSSHRVPLHDVQESATPSDFGLNPRQKLTVADLLPSVTDPRLKKSLKLLSNDNDLKTSSRRAPRKLEVPLGKRQQDRLDRAAAYEKSKEVLSRWIDTVKTNRRAEHLSFPLRDPDEVAAQSTNRLIPVAHAKPLTDLETTIQNILRESGFSPKGNKSQEDQIQAFEELQTNKLALEEVQARRADLRRARELMFREEIRAKRIKKIKSKSYRRVHRKEREKIANLEKDAFAAAGFDLPEDEQERNDRRRAEERMGARHRESKWARSVKATGRAAWDEDARDGVTEMARRGEELKRRIVGKEIPEHGEESLSSGTNSGDEDEMSGEDAERRNQRRLHDRLEQLDQSSEILCSRGNVTRSKLASMKFMQKAEATRKKQNDADVERIQREVAGEDSQSDAEVTEGVGRRTYRPASTPFTRTAGLKPAQENEFQERAASDDENAAEWRDSAAEELEVILDQASKRKKSISSRENGNDRSQHRGGKHLDNKGTSEVAENPWLSGGIKKVKSQTIEDRRAAATILSAPVTGAISASKNGAKPRPAGEGPWINGQNQERVASTDKDEPFNGFQSEDGIEEDHRSPFVIRNQELISRAFAGDEVVADFEKEKLETIRDEEDKVVDNTLPGWGNWTGAGISKKEQKRNKGNFLMKEAGIREEQRKDARLNRVIINEKRVKKVHPIIITLIQAF